MAIIYLKKGHFFVKLLPIFDIFIDCGHIFVPNGVFWGSTSRPHIEDLVMGHIFVIIIISYFIESNPVGPRGGLSGDDGLAPECMGPWAYHTIHCQEHHKKTKIYRNTKYKTITKMKNTKWYVEIHITTSNWQLKLQALCFDNQTWIQYCSIELACVTICWISVVVLWCVLFFVVLFVC